MGERTEKVEEMLKRYEKNQEKVEKRYGTKRITEEIEKLNIKIGIYDLKIEKLQNQLSKLSAVENSTALREKYQKQIEELENGYFDKNQSNLKIERLQAKLSETPQNYGETRKKIQDEIEKLKGGSEDVWIEGKNQYLEEKQELEVELKQRDSHKEVAERERRDIDDKLRVDLAQERITIDKDIDTTKLKIQRAEIDSKLKYQEIKDFKYEYEEYEEEDGKGNKVTKKRVVNEGELEKLKEEYKKLQKNIETQKEILKDLQEAKTICDKELAVFKQKDEEKAEALSKAWNKAKNSEEESKEGEKDKKEGKEKESKNESSNKKEWHPDLTEEQIDEMKAEGIQPGDPEYDTYLRNHGLEVEKQKKNKREDKKENKWHSKLTQEQIDELKAEGIEPGDQEYDMYLRNHGLEVEKQKENKREDEKENKWHSKLTQEQIDELKAEGIEPGDQEYDAYLRNHGIELESKENNSKQKNHEQEKDKVKWASGLTQEQIDELKSAGIQPGDIEYYIYLRDHGIKLDWQRSYDGRTRKGKNKMGFEFNTRADR